MTRNLRYFLLVLFLGKIMFAGAQPALQEQFRTPSGEARPWVIWYWMYGAVSKDGIKADLKAMKDANLGGAYLMTIRGPERFDYPGAVNQLTPAWWEMVRYSMEQADSLGLQLGMHISDGFALAGGPWIKPEESMQKIVRSETITKGGKLRNLELPQPESYQGFYKDIAVYAMPVREKQKENIPVITSDNPDDPRPFSYPEKGFRSEKPVWLQYTYHKPFTLRNIEIVLFGNNYQSHRFTIMASDDGKTFRKITRLTPARHGWQNTDFSSTHAIPPVTARYFRFCWTPESSEPGSEDLDAAKWKPTLRLKELRLSSTPRIHQWEGKAGFVWRIAKRTTDTLIGPEECTPAAEVIELTSNFRDGKLTAKLPAGKWRILRMGHTSTGHTNATGGGGIGLECDKFSEKAVQKQFDNWFGAAFEKTDPELARKVLKIMHIDSWECGSQNWSDRFAAEFKQRRGYDLMPYLPVMAGYPVESAAFTEKVLHDVRETIAELVVDVFYKVLAEASHQKGCRFSAECVAPTMVSDGMLHFKSVDLPMGEFWLRSPTHDKPNDMLDAIHGAHIYGKNIIQAEGFTQLRINWDEYPAMLKPLLDRNFALGMNKLFYHVYVHNPYMDRSPGMTLDGIGLYFQRNQTWWKQGKAWVDYVARCQTLLQFGHPVVDIAVFTGEEIPRRAILPERLVPMLPGIFGEKKVEQERVRLLNEGQPMREMPAGVKHSANMADPEQWIDPLNGYQYDSFNKDALLHLAQVKDGKMTTVPGGNAYKILVLPFARPMNPDNIVLSKESSDKIKTLKEQGIIIPELPFTEADFSRFGIEKDLIAPEDIAWTHRRSERTDIYFISNQENKSRDITVSLRISGRYPEIWNPVDGEISEPVSWKTSGKRTEVSLNLAPFQSLFIVFQKETTSSGGGHHAKLQNIPATIKKYKINFEKTGIQVDTNQLFDWSKHENPRIRYYSGEAIYRCEMKIDRLPEAAKYYLYLPEITGTASLTLNGIDCGVIWTAPFRTDITSALKAGNNELEIRVTNTWANAIRGMDEGIPPFDGIWTNSKYRMPGNDLLPAGLTEPPTILAESDLKE